MSATVLWVFQRPEQRDKVKKALERAGFEVCIAEENLAALETFQRTRPDLVVIEVAFPDTEKLELCQVMKATPQGGETPVLVVTATEDGMSFRAQAIHQFDADEFIYPFESSRIAAVCKRWLERSKAEPRTTPAPHQAVLEDALDKLDTLLEEDVMAPDEASAPAPHRPSTGEGSRYTDPLRESLEELTRMSDELVDRLPIQAHEDTVEQTPPPAAPRDIAKLQQTLEELDKLTHDDQTATSAEVEVAGDRGEDIQAHLDTMLSREGSTNLHAVGSDEDESEELAEGEGEGEDLVTIESEGMDDPPEVDLDLDLDLDEPAPVPEPVRAAEPEISFLDEAEPELARHDEDEAEAAAVAAAAEIEPAPAADEPDVPRFDESLPRMGVPHEEPRRGFGAKGWAAAAVIVLAIGAGVMWLLSGGDDAGPATVVDARQADGPVRGFEPAPVEPHEATPMTVEQFEAEVAAAALVEESKPFDQPPPSPIRAESDATRTEASRLEDAAVASAQRTRGSDAPRVASVATAPPRRTEPKPRPSIDEPAVTRKPAVTKREPVATKPDPATATVALGPKRTTPPRQDPSPASDEPATSGASQVPVTPRTVERSEPVAPPAVAEVAAPRTSEPRRKEVREAPPFVGTEKTGADPKEGRPSDTLAADLTPVAPDPVVEAAPSEPEPQVPAFEPPRVANRAEPMYPSKARKSGARGTIVLDVLVDESGTPVRVVVKEGIGNADVEAATIHAVLRSSFHPARQRGTAVRGWTTAEYVFEP